MRKWVFGVLTSFVMLLAVTSRGDGVPTLAPATPTASAPPEPTTATPASPAPGSETKTKDPFVPYDTGPPEAAWPYTALTPDEQKVADKNRDTTGWDGIHNAYASAVAERAHEAAASAAAAQLGVGGLPLIGIVQ